MRRALLVCAICSCGSVAPGAAAPDAASDDAPSPRPRDAGPHRSDAAFDRVAPHEGVILASPRVLVVYVGEKGLDAAPSQDAFVDWMLASPDYWRLLREYGVDYGSRVKSIQAPRSDIVPPSVVSNGLIAAADLSVQIRAWLAGTDTASANAFVFFLPDGIDVALSVRGNYTYRTCVDAFGYHSDDGHEPFAVMPPCPRGRATGAISHEIAEMATNPEGTLGWFSDDDARRGDEIGDLCSGTPTVGGWVVSQLWSNAQGQCAP